MARVRIRRIGIACARSLRRWRNVTERERDFLLEQVYEVRGLMPLLMKQRGKNAWSVAEKAELRIHLKRLSHLSPYLLLSVIPGSFLALPLLAWWLDRRRARALADSGNDSA